MLHTAITFLSACKTKKKSANKDGVEHGSRIKIVMLHVVMPRFANFSLQERYFLRPVFIDTLMYVFSEYRIVRLESVLHCIIF